MSASVAEESLELASGGAAVINMMLRRFDEAPIDIQSTVAEYCGRLRPLLESEPDEDRERGLVHQIEALLAVDEWSASKESCDRHRRLYAIAMELRKLSSACEAVDAALTADLMRIPTQGWTVEVIRRAGELGKAAPTAAVEALLEGLPAIDWSQPDEAGALARVRAELVPLRRRGKGRLPLSEADAKGAYDHQTNADAAWAAALWLKAGPAPSSVRPIILGNAVLSTRVEQALQKWAAKQSEETRTAIASSLIGLRAKRHLTFAALTAEGVDEVTLMNKAGRVIRGLGKLDQRIVVAETVAGHEFSDKKARAALIRLITYLLAPGKPKGNIEVVFALLPALGRGSLDDPDTLNQSVRRAQKRHGLKFTADQGEQLASLGVKPHKDWFGKRVAEQLKRFL